MIQDNPHGADERGIVTINSRMSFHKAVDRLKSAFASHGIKVFATIDQQVEARAAGLDMPPMVFILFGNPKAGTPLMVARPFSGLDLPPKVLVSKTGGGEVMVSFNSTQYILDRHDLPDRFRANLEPAARLIEKALTD